MGKNPLIRNKTKKKPSNRDGKRDYFYDGERERKEGEKRSARMLC